jgi:chemotaxis family two-component system sensor kinase Cph1
VSHDLKAPLRAIQGFSKLLAEECSSKLSEDEQHYLNAIVQNTTNMNKLVEDLLTFSRLSKQTLVLQDIDMARLFRSVLNELQTIEPSYRRVDVVLVEPIPLINADPTLIRQVVINLLSNAFKFTRNAEHPRIEIGLQSCNSEHVFFIRDNGIGFDMQYAARLFGVFQRLHDVREYEGTGIGLANVKRIIERHGGRVWAEGKLEEGATVYFTLPMSAE